MKPGKQQILDVLLIAAAWLIAALLVIAVYEKAKIFFH
jgi:hypothetical protein